MNILIVTAWYHPFIHPRAHRWTALAEHWAAEGHSVQVLTARVGERPKQEWLHGVEVVRVGFDSLKEWVYAQFGSSRPRGRIGVKPQKPSLSARLGAWVYQKVWKNLYFPDDAGIWYFPARRQLRQILATESIDLLITVSLPFTGHLLGLDAISKAKKNRPFWMADIGDPFSFQAKPPNNRLLYGRKNQALERHILQAADAVTVTTSATLEKYRVLLGEKSVEKMRVIPPLLAIEPASWIAKAEHKTGRSIRIGYFGALYAPTRTPDVFLELLGQTFRFRPDLRHRLEVHFYGEIFPEFFERLRAAPEIRLHGLCSRAASWAAMQDMDILLNIGNTTDFQLPSKAVDYLAAGKPVLNLSHVDSDPFAVFFHEATEGETAGGILNLRVENGKVSEKELFRWLEWLEREKPGVAEGVILKRIAPYRVAAVANKYLAIMDQRK